MRWGGRAEWSAVVRGRPQRFLLPARMARWADARRSPPGTTSATGASRRWHMLIFLSPLAGPVCRLTADQSETYPSTLDKNHLPGRSASAVRLFLWAWGLTSSGGKDCPKTVESSPNCLHYNLQECASVRGSKTDVCGAHVSPKTWIVAKLGLKLGHPRACFSSNLQRHSIPRYPALGEAGTRR